MRRTAIVRNREGRHMVARSLSYARSPDGKFARVSDEAEFAQSAWRATDPARLFAFFGIADFENEDSPDFAKACGLGSLRASHARIVRVGHGRGWAPGFRAALPDEAGEDAVLVPIGNAGTLNFSGLGVHGHADWRHVADVIAIAHPSGVPLSLTGASMAVGDFSCDDRGRLRLYTNGFAWLGRFLNGCAARAGDECLPRIAAALAPRPEASGTLLVDAGAHEWRYWREGAPVTKGAKEIHCVDSAPLAATIAKAMREREKIALPPILAPKERQREKVPA